MDDELEQLVKQLQHIPVELPRHQQNLRKQLLARHASYGRTAGQRPFYLHYRMSTIMTAKRILPVAVIVVLVGVLILGWFWLSPGSGGPSDRRRLARQKGTQGTYGPQMASVFDQHPNQGIPQDPGQQSFYRDSDASISNTSQLSPKLVVDVPNEQPTQTPDQTKKPQLPKPELPSVTLNPPGLEMALQVRGLQNVPDIQEKIGNLGAIVKFSQQ